MADSHARAYSRAPARGVLEVLRDMSHAEARRGRGRRGVFIWGAAPDPDKLGTLCLSASLREIKSTNPLIPNNDKFALVFDFAMGYNSPRFAR